ncbi:MAG: hypothetical protein ACOC93_05975, partial [Planctomycetota bacterium]
MRAALARRSIHLVPQFRKTSASASLPAAPPALTSLQDEHDRILSPGLLPLARYQSHSLQSVASASNRRRSVVAGGHLGKQLVACREEH